MPTRMAAMIASLAAPDRRCKFKLEERGRGYRLGDAPARDCLDHVVRWTRQVVRDRVAEAAHISALGLGRLRYLDLREIACVYGTDALRHVSALPHGQKQYAAVGVPL